MMDEIKLKIVAIEEESVNLTCSNVECVNNMAVIANAHICNLKNIYINNEGKCQYFIDKKENNQ